MIRALVDRVLGTALVRDHLRPWVLDGRHPPALPAIEVGPTTS